MTESTQNSLGIGILPALEALLFAASSPVSPQQLAETLQEPISAVESGLKDLESIHLVGRGLALQRHAGKVQLTTIPEAATLVERFLGLEATAHLSRAALETLAIIAYRQPVTRPAIDAIRGVNSDGVLRSLLSKGLVQEAGRAETPGKPIIYITTPDFLQHFGLRSLAEMPEFQPADIQPKPSDNNLLKD